MTQPSPAAEPPRPRSEMEYDDRGNFAHEGDLYRVGESLPDLCRRIEVHLNEAVPDEVVMIAQDAGDHAAAVVGRWAMNSICIDAGWIERLDAAIAPQS